MEVPEVAVITGAGRPWSLGRACALQLAAKGIHIVVADSRADWGAQAVAAVQEVSGARAVFVETDVGRRDDVKAMVEYALDSFGRIDILINSAAIVENVALADIDDAHIDRVMGINLRGTILTCQAVAPVMRRQGGGRIINLASGAAVRPLRNAGVYSASKASVVALSRVLALELSEDDIVVTVVAPGPMGNNMGSEEAPQRANDTGTTTAAAGIPPQPFGSFPSPIQVAEVITYLATSSSPILAGQTLHANAGAWMT